MSSGEKILEMLEKRYPILLTKKDLSEVMNCSLSTIDNLLKKGRNIPEHIKFGYGRNSSVRFCNADVARFLSTASNSEQENES